VSASRLLLPICLICLAVLISLQFNTLEATESACSNTSTSGHYTTDFIGVTYHPDGTSTWDYTVTWDGQGNQLDKFMLKLCHNANVISASPGDYWVGYSGYFGMYGIRWLNDITTANVPIPFSVTLDAPYAVSKTVYALKSAWWPHYGHICGPSKFCTQSLLPPTNLTCEIDECSCEASLMWNNVTNYDFLLIRVDGNLVQTLPGSATSTTVHVGTGPHLIEVSGVLDVDGDGVYDHGGSEGNHPFTGGSGDHDDCDDDDEDDDDDNDHDGHSNHSSDDDDDDDDDDDEDDDDDDCPDRDQESDRVACHVDCPDHAPYPPKNLSCHPNALDCSVEVNWHNARSYSEIILAVDGVPYVTLPGSATSYTVPGPLIGPHEICLYGTTICGEAFPQVCCWFDCDDPAPPPVEALQCHLVDQCTCEAAISWTNGAHDYDSLDILVDGMLYTTLPGNSTSLNLQLGGSGLHTVCVVPKRNGFTGSYNCCDVYCPPVDNDPPSALICEAPPAPSCEATVTWINEGDYDYIDILVDGVYVTTVPGHTTIATVAIPDFGMHEICIRATTICGEVLMDVCCMVDCIGPPDPIADLNCDLIDICTCETALSWTNGNSDYDMLQIVIDGVLHEQIPGNLTSLNLTLPGNGLQEICVIPVRLGLLGPPVCCDVDCPDIPPNMIENLQHTVDALSCEFTITWDNPVAYSSIDVQLNGMVIATLPGTATTFMLPTPLTGLNEICVQGTTICDEVTPAACITVDCTIPPPLPVLDLVCGPVDPCTCTVPISWTNQENNYDSIRILLDGVEVQSLPGNAVTAVVTLGDVGLHVICVEPVRNGVSAKEQVCCKVTCPITDPISPLILECVVDQISCEATINWQNPSLYSQIEVYLNGELQTTVPGDTTVYSVTLTLPGSNTLELIATTVCGEVTMPVSCNVSCKKLVPPPVTDLNCMVTDPCTCTATASWVNNDTYDSIDLFLDGAFLITLPGNATTHNFSLGGSGRHEVCVIPVINFVGGEATCCDLNCPPIPLLEPNGLVCSVGPSPTCETNVSWTNNSTYSMIEVLLDGAVLQTLSGDATSTVLNLPGPGMRQVCLQATTICGNVLPLACCDVECIFPPDPITDLMCPIDGPPCNGTIAWMNGNPDYDLIEVTLDGAPFATLSGTDTMLSYGPLDPGPHEFCFTAVRQGLSSPPVCCTIDCPFPPPPPVDVTCTVDDICSCDGLVTWVNAANDYDEITVSVDGTVIATLPGNATSAPLTGLSIGSSNICVEATRFGLDSGPACCTFTCPGPPTPMAPTNLVCEVADQATCTIALSWANPMNYSSIEIQFNGTTLTTVAGSLTATNVTLPTGSNSGDICLIGFTECGDASTPTCCEVECQTPFDRGDCNIDGFVDIADGIYIMRFLFQGFPPSICMNACDHNGDGTVDVSDTVYIITYIFMNGTPPPPPFGDCGIVDQPNPGCTMYPFCTN